jgi:hypothetical protein
MLNRILAIVLILIVLAQTFVIYKDIEITEELSNQRDRMIEQNKKANSILSDMKDTCFRQLERELAFWECAKVQEKIRSKNVDN